MKTFLTMLVLGVLSAGAWADDRVAVSLPYPVTIGAKTLPPGDYLIRSINPGSGGRVLGIFAGDERKHEATVMTIPALDNRTPEETKVVLHRFGDEYYFDKIWIQGKDYGYEFVLPGDVKSRMRERSLTAATIPARLDRGAEPVPQPVQTAAANPAPHANAKPEPPVSRADADPAAPAASEAQEPPAAATKAAVGDAPAMPNTAGNWLVWLICGGALTAVGLAARKRSA